MVQRARNQPGVTAIELLIVLAIIAILLSLLIPMFAMVRRKGQIRATETLVSSITAALNQYYTDWDEFPPSTLDYDPNGTSPTVTRLSGPAPDPFSLYKYLNGPTGDGFTARNHHYGPYLKAIPGENLQTTAGELSSWIPGAIRWRTSIARRTCKPAVRRRCAITFRSISIRSDPTAKKIP